MESFGARASKSEAIMCPCCNKLTLLQMKLGQKTFFYCHFCHTGDCLQTEEGKLEDKDSYRIFLARFSEATKNWTYCLKLEQESALVNRIAKDFGAKFGINKSASALKNDQDWFVGKGEVMTRIIAELEKQHVQNKVLKCAPLFCLHEHYYCGRIYNAKRSEFRAMVAKLLPQELLREAERARQTFRRSGKKSVQRRRPSFPRIGTKHNP